MTTFILSFVYTEKIELIVCVEVVRTCDLLADRSVEYPKEHGSKQSTTVFTRSIIVARRLQPTLQYLINYNLSTRE